MKKKAESKDLYAYKKLTLNDFQEDYQTTTVLQFCKTKTKKKNKLTNKKRTKKKRTIQQTPKAAFSLL